MTAWIIGGLVATLAFFLRRLAASRAENALLLTHIAALKRQLARRER